MPTQYVTTIDAGSTSSRLLIYSYDGDLLADDKRFVKPLKFTQVFTTNTQDNMKPDATEEQMKNHLKGLVDRGAVELFKRGNKQDGSVPLYIMATAGMRDPDGEPTAESTKAMRLAWDAVQSLRLAPGGNNTKVYGIRDNNFDAIPPPSVEGAGDPIRDKYSFVVPAKDEGVYAWIALNHDLNRPGSWMHGVLELGGKSMQVAYVDATDEAGKAVCLWRSRYYVKSRSWVLGAEVSRLAAVEDKLRLAAKRLPGKDIFNPCLPAFQRSNTSPESSIGNGDFAKCLAMAKSYLRTKVGTDSLSSLGIQHLASRFYGVSSFWHTYEFFSRLGVYKLDSPYDPKLFTQAVEEYCTSSWLKPFPWIHNKLDDHTYKHCFAAAWMITLLHDHKGFQLERSISGKSLIHFKLEPELGDRSSWTLGAAVMIARHNSAKMFCRAGEDEGRYPPTAFYATNGSSVVPSTPVDMAQPMSTLAIEPAQLVHSLNIPTAPLGNLLPGSFDALDPASTFSVGLVSGVLLIAFVLLGYRRFSTHRAAIQLPVSYDKHDVEVDEQPVVVRSRLAFFEKGKGAIFLAGGNNV